MLDGIQGQALYYFKIPDGLVKLYIHRDPYQGTLGDYLEYQKRVFAQSGGADDILSESKKVIIGGQEGIEIPSRNLSVLFDEDDRRIFVKNGDYVYRIEFSKKYEKKPNFVYVPADEETLRTLDQILSTFRFTPHRSGAGFIE